MEVTWPPVCRQTVKTIRHLGRMNVLAYARTITWSCEYEISEPVWPSGKALGW